jgi:nucleotide-binding universal stress UspA family protein
MYNTILLPVDVEQESSWKSALPTAAKLARDNGASLHVVAVVPPMGSAFVGSFFPKNFEKQVLDKARSRLAEIVAAADVGDLHPQLHLAHGTIYEEILHAAEALEADLIVLSAHRPELRDYLLGPNAARVVRHASQSVFVVRN